MLHDTATEDFPLAHVPMNFLCGDIDAQFRAFLQSKQEQHAALSAESTMSADSQPAAPAKPSELVEGRAPPTATTSTGQVAESGGPASICQGFFSKRRSGPMPAGWECKRTPEGLAYFVDHNTRTTHWEPPLQRGGGPVSISIYQPSTKSIKQEHEEMLALYHEAQAAGYVVDPAGGSAVVAVVSATAPPTSLVPPPGPPAAAPPLRARPCRGVSGPPLAPPGAPDASTQRSFSTLGLAEDAAPVRDLGLKSLSALSSAAGVKLEGKKCSLQTMDASAATEQQSTRSSERRYSVEGQQALPEDSCADLDYDSETTSGTEGEDEDE
jgi:hypothetical protein